MKVVVRVLECVKKQIGLSQSGPPLRVSLRDRCRAWSCVGSRVGSPCTDRSPLSLSLSPPALTRATQRFTPYLFHNVRRVNEVQAKYTQRFTLCLFHNMRRVNEMQAKYRRLVFVICRGLIQVGPKRQVGPKEHLGLLVEEGEAALTRFECILC